jgi:hypothetical protein
LNGLDDELIGLAPAKQRIREITALLLVDRVRNGWSSVILPVAPRAAFWRCPPVRRRS